MGRNVVLVNDDVQAVGRPVLSQGDGSGVEHAAEARVSVESAARFQVPEQSDWIGDTRGARPRVR
jgi:hypothetical protein